MNECLWVGLAFRPNAISFQGFRIIMAEDCWYKSLTPLMTEVRQQMGTHHPVYISFDIDAIDPAYCPGTGNLSIVTNTIITTTTAIIINIVLLIILLLLPQVFLLLLPWPWPLLVWLFYYYWSSNFGVSISEGCFIFDFASLPLKVARAI